VFQFFTVNRTRVELKQEVPQNGDMPGLTVNRTRVELKLHQEWQGIQGFFLLIVLG